jgi:molybdopterin converting factor small subunit
MTVRVKLFAILRDKAGVAELPLGLPDGASVADAMETLAGRLPGLRPHLTRAAAAVNLARATPDTILNDNDELALLPPVSGG